MNPKELLEYEMPSIAEYVSWDWLQIIIAKYVASKVSRKWKRYNHRQSRREWLRNIN